MTSQFAPGIGAESRPPDYEHMYLLNAPMAPFRNVADVAREQGITPVDLMIDLALASDFNQLFSQVILNFDQDAVLSVLRHPRTVVGASDSGAHVSQIMDSSLPTHLLAHWVRDQEAFEWEEGIRMLTGLPATIYGFGDRGLLREGFAADLLVFDPKTIGPSLPTVAQDLPGGATRLKQMSQGIHATVVNGRAVWCDGVHSGSLPGQLLRGPLAHH
jgi:N-acyl-D-aspartate/D-glutamate deacylase